MSHMLRLAYLGAEMRDAQHSSECDDLPHFCFVRREPPGRLVYPYLFYVGESRYIQRLSCIMHKLVSSDHHFLLLFVLQT